MRFSTRTTVKDIQSVMETIGSRKAADEFNMQVRSLMHDARMEGMETQSDVISDDGFYLEMRVIKPISSDGVYFASCEITLMPYDEMSVIRAGVYRTNPLDSNEIKHAPVCLTRDDIHSRECCFFESIAELVGTIAPILMRESQDQLLEDIKSQLPLPALF